MRTLLYLSLTSILFVCGCDKSPPKELGSLEIVSRAPESSNVYIKLWFDGDYIGNYSHEHFTLHPTLGLHTLRAVREISSGIGGGTVLGTNTLEQQIRILGHDSSQQIVVVFPEPQ
jgi:hypothetical protein